MNTHLYFKAVIFQELHWENHSTLMKFFFKQDPYRLILFVNNFKQLEICPAVNYECAVKHCVQMIVD